MSIKISGVYITFNEEEYIEKNILSIKNFVDEIVVVDSYSTDSTKELCLKHNVVFIEKKFESFGKQKQFAVQQAKYDIVLCLDADEFLCEQAKDAVLEVKNKWEHDGYWIKRKNYYCGRWLKYSGKYPDKKLRLFDRRKGNWVDRLVHETVEMQQPKNTSLLKGNLIHYEYFSYFKHARKVEYYSTLSAKHYLKKGKKSNLWQIFYRPTWAFLKNYILRLGFLDGSQGLIVCCFTAYSTFLKYVKLYGLQKGQAVPQDKA